MDWEEKVSSLLRDTEANLSRVKVKFEPRSSGTKWNPTNLSNTMPLRRYSSLSEITPRNQASSLPMAGHFRTSSLSPGLNMIQPPPPPSLSTSSLQEKLDQQNKLIDQLMQMVHKLDSERNNYNEQIRDIKGTLQQLENTRDVGRGTDVGMERRVEQVRRELQAEIHSLHTQMQLYKSSAGSSNQDHHITNLSRDLHDVKQSLRDEMEGIKRDMDLLRNRILRLEVDAPSTFHASPDRSAARIEAALKDITAKSPSYSPLPAKRMLQHSSHNPSTWSYQTARGTDNGQLTDIRQTLSSLESKINNMESSLHGRNRLQRNSSMTNGISPYKISSSYPTNGNSALMHNRLSNSNKTDAINNMEQPELRMEDLNLSDDDDDSTSLDTFGAESVKIKVLNTKVTNGHNTLDVTDDDLDLDDLDLSDDTISLDLEPLDSAQF